MAAFFIHWLVVAAALWIAAQIVPGVTLASWSSLAFGALSIGFVNAVIKPILTILTLPITIITLGLFYLVVNAAAFAMAAAIVPGFDIAGFWAAVGGALLVSLISWVLGSLLAPRS